MTSAVLDVVELLQPWRTAGVLSASDVHTAAALVRLGGERHPDVALAAALAARAPRVGHVCADLTTIAATVVAESELDVAPVPMPAWPEPAAWVAAVAASPLVSAPDAALVLRGSSLYLQRYRSHELVVAEQLRTRASSVVPAIGTDLSAATALLTGEGAEQQRAVVAAALRSAVTVLVGGPGTGKTTTVAALLATLVSSSGDLSIALAAPTGKAAARLGDAFRAAAARLPDDVASRLAAATPSTIHRLLGATAGSTTRFRHGPHRPLPHDVVIVDETSMVSLPLMARLLEAIRPDARLVLVGDPDQLASVEAGSVLGDIAGPALDRPGVLGPLAGSVSRLEHSRRFPPGSAIDRFATAVRAGDAGAAMAVLADGGAALAWLPVPGDDPAAVEGVRAAALPGAVLVRDRAEVGDAVGALAAVEQVRVLCAHRRGPFGVERWNERIEAWLRDPAHPTVGWYLGRPVVVTANDYRLGLFNGDLGVVVAGEQRPVVAFAATDEPTVVAPARLDAVETVHATTIHKSQGSEFDHVVVVLPPAASRLATRELLYTAVTRARHRVTVVGDESAIRAAVERRVVRTGGLRDELWPLG